MTMEHKLNQFTMYQLFQWSLLMDQKELVQDLVQILCAIIQIKLLIN